MRLTVEAIPVPRGYIHPPPKNDVLPKHEFTMGIIAPKGSGKTTLIANLLNFYKGYFHSILIFSPTVASDEKWDYVKEQDLLTDNVPLKKWLKSLEEEEDDNAVVHKPKSGLPLQGLVNPNPLLDKKIPEKCFYAQYDDDTLSEIMQEQLQMVRLLKKCGKSKHLANR